MKHFVKHKIYILGLAICFLTYSWLYYNYLNFRNSNHDVVICYFKNWTGLPCPSCGSTRSLINILHANWGEALFINPLGYLIAFVIIIFPIWIVSDLVMNKNSLKNFYEKMENHIKSPKIYFPLLVLILSNWIWNISKMI